MNPTLFPKLVIDSPNVLFYHKHKKDQIDKNLIALLNFVLVNNQPMIFIVTPLMMKTFETEITWISSIVETNRGTVVYSENNDPDIVVLQIAENESIPILTNDKFRQSKYKKFKSRKNRLNFVIRSAVLNIISKHALKLKREKKGKINS